MPSKRDGENKRRVTARTAMLISAAMLFVVCALTYLVLSFTVAPRKYELAAGDVSPYSIHAPYTVTDDAATKILKDSARAKVDAVFTVDSALAAGFIADAEGYFASVYDMRDNADVLADSAGETLSTKEWNARLTDDQLDALCALFSPRIEHDELFTLLSADLSGIQALRTLVSDRLETSLRGGVSADGLPGVVQAFSQEAVTAPGLTEALRSLAVRVFERYCGETCVEDAEATRVKREQAAALVEDVQIKKGEVIVEQGDTVTVAQLAALRELNLLSEDKATALPVGLALYVLAIYAAFAAYMISMEPETFTDVRRMAAAAAMLTITVLLSWLTITLDAHVTPALFAVLLTAILVNERTAIAVSALLAFTIGAASGNAGDNLFGFNSLTMAVTIFISGCVSTITVKRTVKRGSVIAAGAVGGGAAALVLLGIYLMAGEGLKVILIDMLWVLGCSVICAILAVGSLTIWERLFDTATPARLNELLNANHKLMKQLMLEAPGTYQHSVAAAALAEGAAQRIGADALLVKVAAYYHDVGKLRRPHYFMENQKSGNIHDTLPPADSAAAIIAHQRDGVIILEKHKFPSAVIKIAGEHHGNSLMTYFYYKACEQQGKESVDIRQYRYTSGRPSTRESAIVMLADSCEAAVRSLGECTREQMEDMVHKVIAGKMKDGDNQLSRAPVTVAELQEIEKSFIKTLAGLMHERIEYPEASE